MRPSTDEAGVARGRDDAGLARRRAQPARPAAPRRRPGRSSAPPARGAASTLDVAQRGDGLVDRDARCEPGELVALQRAEEVPRDASVAPTASWCATSSSA